MPGSAALVRSARNPTERVSDRIHRRRVFATVLDVLSSVKLAELGIEDSVRSGGPNSV